MAKWYEGLTPELTAFIKAQHVFFVATASREARINLSPKGMDTFRVLDENHVAYLDLTGSGNETAAHLLEDGRITIMFCSFDQTARIARLYGHGSVIHPWDARWSHLIAAFPSLPGVRQVMDIRVESAMTSCGYGVPRMAEMTPRDTLEQYWHKKGRDSVEQCWREHNQRSIDGLPTGIFPVQSAHKNDT